MHNYPLPLSFDVSNFRSTFQNFTRLNTRGSDQLLLLNLSFSSSSSNINLPQTLFPLSLYTAHTLARAYLRIIDARLLSSRFYRLEVRGGSEKGKEEKKKVSTQGERKKMKNFSRLQVLRAPLCRRPRLK